MTQDVAGPWTPTPGLPFSPAGDIAKELDGTPALFVVNLSGDVSACEFVLNDGGPHYRWDKASGGG
ncbi:hypothetical protein, partial [Herbidospora sp. RD11066]